MCVVVFGLMVHMTCVCGRVWFNGSHDVYVAVVGSMVHMTCNVAVFGLMVHMTCVWLCLV